MEENSSGGGFLSTLENISKGALDVYQNLETKKLENRLVKSQNKQLALMYQVEQASNFDTSEYDVPMSLRFDWKIFLGVVGLGLAGVAAYSAIKG